MKKQLIDEWFSKWSTGNFLELPISNEFVHISPFGTIQGKSAYIDLVQKNKDKFLGYTFDIHDEMYGMEKACVRYTARQGEDFTLDVSEWYYFNKNEISQIIAYCHIGEIRAERQLNT